MLIRLQNIVAEGEGFETTNTTLYLSNHLILLDTSTDSLRILFPNCSQV